MEDKMIVTMTESELKTLICSVVEECVDRVKRCVEKNVEPVEWVYGIAGLKDALEVGTNKAVEIHRQGIVDEAIERLDYRRFRTNAGLARKLWKQHLVKVKQGIA